ncbi:MAG: hypothetical protein WA364_15065 [Candidatus Nitrosopolaris sp.]
MYKKYVLVVIPLVLTLMGSISVGVGIAHATNESSYKFGYQQGKLNWSGCTDPGDKYGNTKSCVPAGDVCSQPIIGAQYDSAVGYDMQVVVGHIDNATACMHGYIHAWNHVCDLAALEKVESGYHCPTDMKEQTTTN